MNTVLDSVGIIPRCYGFAIAFDRVFHLILSDVPVAAFEDVAVVDETVFDRARRPWLSGESFFVGVGASAFTRSRVNVGCEKESE
jgi:hypothetical protein